MYDSVMQNMACTNNQSEGLHNRFRVMFGKYHPSLYAFFKELQKVQVDTEVMRYQLALDQPIRKKLSLSKKLIENRILHIVQSYAKYREENQTIDHLKLIGYNIHI